MLHFECAPHRVHHAAEFDDRTIAGALDDAAMVHGDCGINQVAAQRAQSRQRAFLVRPCEPAVADDIRD